MSLFQKQPLFKDTKPLYTLGLNKTILLIGLGNVGKKFESTRHNIGFICMDSFVKETETMGDWQDKKALKAIISMGNVGSNRVIAIKPTTMMNLSGEAIRAVIDYFKIPMENVLIIYDDVDINFGQIKTQTGGSSAGHNGVKSVIDLVGESFSRVRVGIGPKKPAQIDSADFVLAKFSKDEVAHMDSLKKEAVGLLIEFVYSGQINKETRSFII